VPNHKHTVGSHYHGVGIDVGVSVSVSGSISVNSVGDHQHWVYNQAPTISIREGTAGPFSMVMGASDRNTPSGAAGGHGHSGSFSGSGSGSGTVSGNTGYGGPADTGDGGAGPTSGQAAQTDAPAHLGLLCIIATGKAP
jgi:hypothetical protein